MVSVIGYSQVKFWHAHLYFKHILAGYSFGTQAQAWAQPSPGLALSSGLGLSFNKPEPTQAQLKPGC